MDYLNSEINRLKVEEHLKKYLYIDNAEKDSIEWGMNYITFAPSKRVRPLLLLESAIAVGDIDNDAYVLASVVENIHTYSLIHDDLPCMDNDDIRRGQKTLHVIKNEAFALLVGDAILTRVLDLFTHYKKTDRIPYILQLINDKAGYKGMIKGQLLDINGEGNRLSIDEILNINLNKTARLFELSLMLGAINYSITSEAIYYLEELGTNIGHIFQIQDDILDFIGDSNVMGKRSGIDFNLNKSSIVYVHGIDNARRIMDDYADRTKSIIAKMPKNREFFTGLVDYLLTRTK